MPIYMYRCQSCNEVHEALQKVSDDKLTKCPHCGEEALKRIIAPVGIQFKGSGWHVTDYKSGGGGSGSKKEEKKSSEGSGSSDTSKSSETKSGGESKSGGGDSSNASSKVA